MVQVSSLNLIMAINIYLQDRLNLYFQEKLHLSTLSVVKFKQFRVSIKYIFFFNVM